MKTPVTALLFLLKKFTDSSNKGSIMPAKTPEGPFIITSIAECKSYFYLGTTHGLLCKNKRNGKLLLHTTENSGLPSNHITSILCSTDGKRYVGTIHGLIQQRFNGFRQVKAEDYTFSNTHITALAEDKLGRIWIGTGHSGIVRSSIYTPESFMSQPITFPNQKIYSITTDTWGSVWIGYTCGGFECFQNGLSYNYPSVHAIESSRCKEASSFLLSSGNQDVFIYNGNNLISILSFPSHPKMTCAYYNPKYSRMMICHESGLNVFDIQKPYAEPQKMPISEFIRAISCRSRDQAISKLVKWIEEFEHT
jgi:hypothetical protein